jgi:N-acetylglucosaminyldiphosphoundecaprenol N-acetyl-beta-D-mannosaminyltransferase
VSTSLPAPIPVPRQEPGRESSARARVLGLPVDALSMDAAVATIAERIATGGLQRVVVTNANKAWLAARHAEMRRMMESADLVIAEYATAWAARRLGIAGIEHVGGLTLMVRLLEEAALRGWTVFLLGARQPVLERLVQRLRRERPELRLVGHAHGYLDAGQVAAVRAQLAACTPDLLFVATGSPKQERFIFGLEEGMAKVAIGVGGSFDVIAGVKKDAPSWMRGRGLEWLYRLGQDPANLWRRYLLTNPWFAWQVAREAWARRR